MQLGLCEKSCVGRVTMPPVQGLGSTLTARVRQGHVEVARGLDVRHWWSATSCLAMQGTEEMMRALE